MKHKHKQPLDLDEVNALFPRAITELRRYFYHNHQKFCYNPPPTICYNFQSIIGSAEFRVDDSDTLFVLINLPIWAEVDIAYMQWSPKELNWILLSTNGNDFPESMNNMPAAPAPVIAPPKPSVPAPVRQPVRPVQPVRHPNPFRRKVPHPHHRPTPEKAEFVVTAAENLVASVLARTRKLHEKK